MNAPEPTGLRAQIAKALVDGRHDHDHNENLVISEENATDAVSAVVEPELAALRAEIAALRAGEDDTPISDREIGTPEQVLYRVNRMTGEERQQWMRHVVETRDAASRCFVMQHVGQIENLRAERDRAHDEARELRARPTQHAYEAACEALERRRVALVVALQLPADTAFYDAVKSAVRLIGGAV